MLKVAVFNFKGGTGKSTTTKELDYRLLKTTVPENISVAEAIAHQQPVIEYAASSTGAKAYKSLATECVRVWK